MNTCNAHDTLVEKINDIGSDLKVLVSEFKAMNGALRNTKKDFEKHSDESKVFRSKVITLWGVVHTVKWAIGLLVGTGVIVGLISKLSEYVAR